MEVTDPQKQQRVEKGSSIRRKPFSDLTNLIREPHRRSTSFSQSKKPITSPDPAMSTGIQGLVQHQFTAPRDQHPLPTPRPRTPSPATLNFAPTQKRQYDSVRDGKRIAYSGNQTMMKTSSKIKNNMRVVPTPHSSGKMKDKINEISVPPKYPPLENTINKESLSGVKFNNTGKIVVGSNSVDLSKKYEGKMVATPINYEVNGAEDSSANVPLPNNKKRSHSSKISSRKFVLPQDFIEQQRAYFKEIDEYELQVEEEGDVSA